MYFKMAWRNLWRNRRRTIITISAIALAVVWSAVLTSIQRGTWDSVIDSMSKFYLGYGQIHSKGFWSEQSLDLVFDPNEVTAALNSKLPTDVNLIPRLESFALASTGNQTKGVLLLGYDAEKESTMTNLNSNIIEGGYPQNSDNGVLVGDKLSEKLHVKIHDSLVLVGQGYQGQNAVGKYCIKGIVRMRSPEINKQLVAMPLPLIQSFLGTGDQITAYAINVPSKKYVPSSLDIIKKNMDTSKFEVMDYNELIPELVEAARFDTATSKLILYILYMLIGFGLLGTIVMMTKERGHEFGVLTAIGTEKKMLAIVLWIESILLSMAGAVSGILLSIPIVYYLFNHPIRLSGKYAETYERFGMEPIVSTTFTTGIFIEQAIILFIIASVLSIYPVWKIFKLDALTAMRN